MGSKILGTGMFLPEHVVTNADIEKVCDTNDEWIRKRTGIHERRFADEGIGASDLGIEAAKQALDSANVAPEDIDAIICCTVTPDQVSPGSAQLIQAGLGCTNAAGFDLNAACSGYVYGLATADAHIKTGLFQRILLVGAETPSRFVNWELRDTAILFADGAGAMVIEAAQGDSGLLSAHLGSDGSAGDILGVSQGGWRHRLTPEHVAEDPLRIHMDGRELFKRAVRKMHESAKIALEKANVSPEEVSLFVPHQANARIIEAVRERMDIPEEKVILNIHKTGNTVAASIPMALHEAREAGRINDGDLILFGAFGAGLTWGAALLRW